MGEAHREGSPIVRDAARERSRRSASAESWHEKIRVVEVKSPSFKNYYGNLKIYLRERSLRTPSTPTCPCTTPPGSNKYLLIVDRLSVSPHPLLLLRLF